MLARPITFYGYGFAVHEQIGRTKCMADSKNMLISLDRFFKEIRLAPNLVPRVSSCPGGEGRRETLRMKARSE